MTHSGSSGIYGIIPARYHSSRFPGKPLAMLGNKPMILWVVEQTLKARGFDEVIVATDHSDIYDVVSSAGYSVQMTAPDHPSGSDRLWEVVATRPNARYIVNIQGDEPFINPRHLEDLINALVGHNHAVSQFSGAPRVAFTEPVDMVTLKVPLTDPVALLDPNTVKVVTTQDDLALYFSRSPIPYQSNATQVPVLTYQHVGVYGYTRAALERFVLTPPSPLELQERLEQLRALDLGLKIGVLTVDNHSKGVDTPQDLEHLSQLLNVYATP